MTSLDPAAKAQRLRRLAVQARLAAQSDRQMRAMTLSDPELLSRGIGAVDSLVTFFENCARAREHNAEVFDRQADAALAQVAA